MTTIDHAAEARKALNAAIEVPADVEAAADPWLLAAQVHATLALVEAQREANEHQRIANLIAWTTANGAEPTELVEAQITEGLGL